jgi:DNA repair exonuclease SbcCD ATPase subunit
VEEFLNSSLENALPMDGLIALTEFLEVSASSRQEQSTSGEALLAGPTPLEDMTNAASEAFTLSSVVEGQLVHAENETLIARRVQSQHKIHAPDSPHDANEIAIYHPVSHQFREAMYSALMTVMEERDEAHARMVAAGVLHVHEMEQQRKAVRRISAEMEALRQSQQVDSSFNEENRRRLERQMQQDSEAELISLCQQLAGEISARTSSALEVVRLKESRKIERENEAAERLALEEELRRTKELLQSAQTQLEQLRQGSQSLQQSIDDWVQRSDLKAQELS